MSKIRIGVMGCANIAKKSIIPAIKRLSEQFELVAVSSRDEDKANEFANLFECKAVVGYDSLLNEAIDAVYIPLPTGLHEEWITKALISGKHVYAEKSIANSFSSAQKMVGEAKNRNLALMEGYMFQYHTQHQKVKQLIADDAIGEIRSFSGAFGFPPLDKNNFRYDEIIGGGALFDAAGYPLRALHFMMGSPFKVAASSLYFNPETGTSIYGSAFLKNDNGIGAHIAFGFDNFYQCNYEIWGSKGKITVERAYTPAPDYKPIIVLEKQGVSETIIEAPCNHFVGAMNEFYNVVSDKSNKQNHYEAILLQSESLELIKTLSINN